MLTLLVRSFREWPGRAKSDRNLVVDLVFNAGTFAGSAMLLLGITEPALLAVIGDTTVYLLIAGLAGVVHGAYAVFSEA